jgi:hypothetical protein
VSASALLSPPTLALSPYERARAVYASEPCVRTFEMDLLLHLRNGWVHSDPDLFFMARPVSRSAAVADIVDPAVVFEREECDCWHVYLLAGEISLVWRFAPYLLPWCSFERLNAIRFYPCNKIVKRFR